MGETTDYLIEIGTEELPPVALPELSRAFRETMAVALRERDIRPEAIKEFATPRRLALLIQGLPVRQPDKQIERRGPALTAAYDAQGMPTRAALGFATACGVSLEQLHRSETAKGAWLVHRTVLTGQATAEILAALVEKALGRLPIPRRMRWGTGDAEFVRPVHWIVSLLGEDVLPGTIMGLPSGRKTYGHRFHHPQPISLQHPAEYANALRSEGYVIANFGERRQLIRERVEAAAAAIGGCAVIKEALLAEVTALVEWPIALCGSFDRRFLDMPPEVLICTMQDNQKYFPVVNEQNQLMSAFVTVSNIESQNPAVVRAGNERVVRPRLADAEFFWNQDRRRTLASRVPDLAQVTYQRKLGSLADKVQRVVQVAAHLGAKLGADPMLAHRAAELGKCDLLTHMVYEFPELQGVMGRYYAAHDGENPAVARAIEEQYLPRYAGDRIPTSAVAQALALAERFDSLIGSFAIGQQPTGAKDPFALRRNGLGVVRTIIEGGLVLDLESDLRFSASTFPESIDAGKAVAPVLAFLRDRLRGYYLEQGFSVDEVEAVAAAGISDLTDFDARIRAVAAFRKLAAASSLEAANKRIRNILRRDDGSPVPAIDPTLLLEPAEKSLASALASTRLTVVPLFSVGRYAEALHALAELHGPVDSFFDEVLVMSEDPNLRMNRLALLGELESLFATVADFSRLQR